MGGFGVVFIEVFWWFDCCQLDNGLHPDILVDFSLHVWIMTSLYYWASPVLELKKKKKTPKWTKLETVYSILRHEATGFTLNTNQIIKWKGTKLEWSATWSLAQTLLAAFSLDNDILTVGMTSTRKVELCWWRLSYGPCEDGLRVVGVLSHQLAHTILPLKSG